MFKTYTYEADVGIPAEIRTKVGMLFKVKKLNATGVMVRDGLITEPLTVAVDGFLGGKAFSVYKKLAGGVPSSVGASLLVEQRLLQHHLSLGDLVKKRKKERGAGVCTTIVDTFQLDEGHYSDPLVHPADSTNTILMSWPLVLVWLLEMRQNYAKALQASIIRTQASQQASKQVSK